jgi:hypothetical protein
MRKKIVIAALAVAVVAVMVATALTALSAPIRAVPNAKLTISYNPVNLGQYRAPLSSMGMAALSKQAPHLGSNAPIAVGHPSNSGGVSSIPINAVRFIRDGSYLPQTETTISVDPSATGHLVGGYNDARWFFCGALPASACPTGSTISLSGFTNTANGGTSLMHSNDLPGLLETEHNATASFTGFLVSWGDPSIAATTNGQFYYASLAIDPNTGANGVELSVSNSNLWNASKSCATPASMPWVNHCWSSTLVSGNMTVGAGSFEDKETIAVDWDSSSPYFGDAYVAWDHFLPNGTSASEAARCTPSLACTMISGGGKPYVSNPDIFVAWSTPAVSANGHVYVSWCNYGTLTTLNPITCSVRGSSNGGSTWGTSHVILSYDGSGTTLPKAYPTVGFATEQFRTTNIPSFAADTSTHGGALWYTLQVCVQGSYYNFFPAFISPGDCGLSSIVATMSTNGGASWSKPVTVSSPAVNFQPSVSVDPQNGNVVIAYYTTAYDPWNHRVDVVTAVSHDHGATWDHQRVSNVSDEIDSDPTMYDYTVGAGFGGSMDVPQFGDYMTVVAHGGTSWILACGDYQVEQGTFQADPWLYHIGEGAQ